MRYKLGLIVLSILVLTNYAVAQQSAQAEEKLEKLRLELIDVQGKEESLRARAQQLDEDIKPENIARSLAGFGSTKPEELREFRRRQLELERKGVLQQLETVSAKRLELEAEIALAETQAYHESAQPKPSSVIQAFVARSSNAIRPLLIGLAAGVFIVMGGAIFLIRRFRSQ
jgi:sugar diacid utilization regulator